MPAPWSGGAKARIIGEIHGTQTVNVLHFATNEAIQDDDALDDLLLQLAQALLACVVDTLLPAMSSDWKVVRVEAQRISPVVSDPIIATAVPDSNGEGSAASTSFIASLVNVRTGGGGRRGRGRMFLPPVGEAQIAASDIDGPTLLLITQFLACVASKFMGANPTTVWRFGVLSTTSLKALGGTFDNSFRPATSLNPVATATHLHSRKKGIGS